MAEKNEEGIKEEVDSGQESEIASFFTEMPSGDDVSKGAEEGERTPSPQESQERVVEGEETPKQPDPDGQTGGEGADASSAQNEQSLEDQAALRRIAQALEQRPAQPQQEKKEKDEELPNYMFDIPSDLVRALRSEDESEARQGIQMLLSGVLKAAHNAIRQEFTQRLATNSETLQKQMSEAQAQVQVRQAVTADFYQAYPQLNNPAVQPIVSQVWDHIVRTENPQQWTEQLRTRIGNAVIERIKSMAQASGLNAVVPQNDPIPQKQVNSGARPGPSRIPQRDEITELYTDG